MRHHSIWKLLVAYVLVLSSSGSAQRRLERSQVLFPRYSDTSLHTTPLPMISAGLPVGRSVPVEVVRGPYRSVQVNVDEWGRNILGDASNETSIVVDPSDYRKMAIGWRQFNAPDISGLREAGVGFSRNGGHHWSFPGSLWPGVFSSDPVLDVDELGAFYYVGISIGSEPTGIRIFKSFDGGVTWSDPILHTESIDKPWIAIDRTGGPGTGVIYLFGNSRFMRSTDRGTSFQTIQTELEGIGTVAVGPDGELYAADVSPSVHRSINPAQVGVATIFDFRSTMLWSNDVMTCSPVYSYSPNWGGLGSQPWVATDHSDGSSRGNVYYLSYCVCFAHALQQWVFPLMLRRSTDRGETWSDPVWVNHDPPTDLIYAWFPMISVAPNGRIDVVWNDTRNSPLNQYQVPQESELYYSYSTDAGVTWSPNEPVSPPFNHYVGSPGASPKLGDYYTMTSDNLGVNVAYAATFNGEQDIWFLRIGPHDCNGNDIPDLDDIANGTSMNCNGNDIPDECEFAPDATGDGRVNLADFATMQNCFTGTRPTAFAHEFGVDLCCTRLDANADAVIDFVDYVTFDEAFMK